MAEQKEAIQPIRLLHLKGNDGDRKMQFTKEGHRIKTGSDPMPGASKDQMFLQGPGFFSPFDPVLTPIDIDRIKKDMAFVMNDESARAHVLQELQEQGVNDMSSLVQLLAQDEVPEEQKLFFRDFVLWLCGRPVDPQDKNNTPWLKNAPSEWWDQKKVPDQKAWDRTKYVIPGEDVAKFVNSIMSAREKFAKQLEDLQITFKGGLMDAYIYFKYLIRGNRQPGSTSTDPIVSKWLGDLKVMTGDVLSERDYYYDGTNIHPKKKLKSPVTYIPEPVQQKEQPVVTPPAQIDWKEMQEKFKTDYAATQKELNEKLLGLQNYIQTEGTKNQQLFAQQNQNLLQQVDARFQGHQKDLASFVTYLDQKQEKLFGPLREQYRGLDADMKKVLTSQLLHSAQGTELLQKQAVIQKTIEQYTTEFADIQNKLTFIHNEIKNIAPGKSSDQSGLLEEYKSQIAKLEASLTTATGDKTVLNEKLTKLKQVYAATKSGADEEQKRFSEKIRMTEAQLKEKAAEIASQKELLAQVSGELTSTNLKFSAYAEHANTAIGGLKTEIAALRTQISEAQQTGDAQKLAQLTALQQQLKEKESQLQIQTQNLERYKPIENLFVSWFGSASDPRNPSVSATSLKFFDYWQQAMANEELEMGRLREMTIMLQNKSLVTSQAHTNATAMYQQAIIANDQQTAAQRKQLIGGYEIELKTLAEKTDEMRNLVNISDYNRKGLQSMFDVMHNMNKDMIVYQKTAGGYGNAAMMARPTDTLEKVNQFLNPPAPQPIVPTPMPIPQPTPFVPTPTPTPFPEPTPQPIPQPIIPTAPPLQTEVLPTSYDISAVQPGDNVTLFFAQKRQAELTKMQIEIFKNQAPYDELKKYYGDTTDRALQTLNNVINLQIAHDLSNFTAGGKVSGVVDTYREAMEQFANGRHYALNDIEEQLRKGLYYTAAGKIPEQSTIVPPFEANKSWKRAQARLANFGGGDLESTINEINSGQYGTTPEQKAVAMSIAGGANMKIGQNQMLAEFFKSYDPVKPFDATKIQNLENGMRTLDGIYQRLGVTQHIDLKKAAFLTDNAVLSGVLPKIFDDPYFKSEAGQKAIKATLQDKENTMNMFYRMLGNQRSKQGLLLAFHDNPVTFEFYYKFLFSTLINESAARMNMPIPPEEVSRIRNKLMHHMYEAAGLSEQDTAMIAGNMTFDSASLPDGFVKWFYDQLDTQAAPGDYKEFLRKRFEAAKPEFLDQNMLKSTKERQAKLWGTTSMLAWERLDKHPGYLLVETDAAYTDWQHAGGGLRFSEHNAGLPGLKGTQDRGSNQIILTQKQRKRLWELYNQHGYEDQHLRAYIEGILLGEINGNNWFRGFRSEKDKTAAKFVMDELLKSDFVGPAWQGPDWGAPILGEEEASETYSSEAEFDIDMDEAEVQARNAAIAAGGGIVPEDLGEGAIIPEGFAEDYNI